MIIQHNIMALNAHRQLGGNNTLVSKNLEKLSSGFRINRAGDDAAGLAISEKMRAQITGLTRAQQNAQDGISLVQTAEGSLTEVHSMLNRMVDLATQSSNGTMDKKVDGDRQKIQDEVDALLEEIDRISKSTNFNGINLLDGSLASGAASGNAATINGAVDTTAATIGGATGITGGSSSANVKSFVLASGFEAAAAAAVPVGDTQAVSVSYNSTDKVFELKVGTTLVATAAPVSLTGTGGEALSFKTAGNVEVATMSYTGHADADDAKLATDFDGTAGKGLVGGATVTIAASATPAAGGLTLQIGDTADDFNKVTVSVDDMSVVGLGLSGLKVNTEKDAADSIELIKSAINTVSTNRSKLGALQNRLEHTINNLGVTTENMTAAESRIRDVDMAKEMMAFTKNNVLTQAAQAMLAQANQQPQQVLQLLR